MSLQFVNGKRFAQLVNVRYLVILYTPPKYHFAAIYILLPADGDCGEGPSSCEGCGTKIVDRFLMRVGSSSWHEHCVTCSACGVPLSKSCYYRHNGLYCKNDYDRYVLKLLCLADGHVGVESKVEWSVRINAVT